MLSSLPTELIREIIESTVPHSFHSTTYQERQNTLRSLSLVSKLFRSIAQPLLLEIVWVTSREEIDRLPDVKVEGNGRPGIITIRWAVVELDEKATEGSLRKFSKVEALSLVNNSDYAFDLSILSSFHNLSSLQIAGDGWSRNHSLCLSKLRSLTLHDLYTDIHTSLLNVAVLPNLQSFALVGGESPEELDRSTFRQLLPQLESMFFGLWFWEEEETTAQFLHPKAESTLIDCSTSSLRGFSSQLPLVHIRIWNLHSDTLLWSEEDETLSMDLNDLVSFLQATPSCSLQSIYLDSTLQSLGSLQLVTSPQLEARKALEDLFVVCQERKIDLVFENRPGIHETDPCISPEFSRRQEVRRRSKALV